MICGVAAEDTLTRLSSPSFQLAAPDSNQCKQSAHSSRGFVVKCMVFWQKAELEPGDHN